MLRDRPLTPEPDRRGLYGISVTSELTGVPAPNLRSYEAKGLIEPARTEGGTRRYSDHDIARIERITMLLEAGLNLRGIGYVLDLEAETRRLREEIEQLRAATQPAVGGQPEQLTEQPGR